MTATGRPWPRDPRPGVVPRDPRLRRFLIAHEARPVSLSGASLRKETHPAAKRPPDWDAAARTEDHAPALRGRSRKDGRGLSRVPSAVRSDRLRLRALRRRGPLPRNRRRPHHRLVGDRHDDPVPPCSRSPAKKSSRPGWRICLSAINAWRRTSPHTHSDPTKPAWDRARCPTSSRVPSASPRPSPNWPPSRISRSATHSSRVGSPSDCRQLRARELQDPRRFHFGGIDVHVNRRA